MLKRSVLASMMVAGSLGLLASPDSADAAMLVRYTFDEASSGTTTALNSGTLGAAANGTFNNSATRTASTPGSASLGALDVSASGNNYIAASGDIAALDTPSALTLTIWVNMRSAPTTDDTLIADRDGTGAGWFLGVRNISGNDFRLRFSTDVTAPVSTVTTSANLTWRFVAVVFDSTANLASFYTGSENAAVTQLGSTIPITANPADNATALQVGAHPAVATLTPPAWLDDARVYDTVLTSAQLDAIRLENIPEPASLALLGLGGGSALFLARRGRVREALSGRAATVRERLLTLEKPLSYSRDSLEARRPVVPSVSHTFLSRSGDRSQPGSTRGHATDRARAVGWKLPIADCRLKI